MKQNLGKSNCIQLFHNNSQVPESPEFNLSLHNYIGGSLICHTCLICYTRVSQLGPSIPLGFAERFSGAHEQMPLLNSSSMILQNPKQR